jgi:hypothetical protein
VDPLLNLVRFRIAGTLCGLPFSRVVCLQEAEYVTTPQGAAFHVSGTFGPQRSRHCRAETTTRRPRQLDKTSEFPLRPSGTST